MAITAGAIIAQGRASRANRSPVASSPDIRVDVRRTAGVPINRLLFGLGVDLPAQSYFRPGDPTCKALAGAEGVATLVRVGAATADDYDWRTDLYFDPLAPRKRPHSASFGCLAGPVGSGASVLRVLDRVRALHASAVVVLNGEIDDPQSAAELVRLVIARYGLAFARGTYWEIGNAPAQWEHFGVPLAQRRMAENVRCSPDQYAALVTSYAAALAAALGADPRIVADQWIANATDQSWTGVVSAVDTRYYPYDSPDVEPSTLDIARSSARLDPQISNLDADLAQYQPGHTVPLFVGQWNIDANPQASDPVYDSAAQAVYVSELLLRLMRASTRSAVTMAAWGQPLYTTSQSPFTAIGAPHRGFRVFAALRALAGARLLRTVNTSGLDCLAARLPSGRPAVVLVNASTRGVLVHLHVDGRAAHRITVAVQTFAGAGPGGVTTSTQESPADMPVGVPALGVVMLTL